MDTVHLGDDLGIEASTGLKERLAPYLDRVDAVVLDAADVRRVHTAGMQVLCAFFASRAGIGHPTRLQGSSEQMLDAARLLGLGPVLGLGDGSPDPSNATDASTVENAA
ncbi:STAS domain-containing protein [Luteimonas terrae]|uniref:ABC-type transporter Mla MlaB component n=1 Tax=Luteimonas terrae TaxID=1530191 RepID=A0ABU1XUU2_9GAMM|nr:STAS domain-containing protein [Luteimonas terrae]MDR7192534.1 ABC-type transporter Mla MlaB component [Luteimonas terrae]